MLSSDAAVTIEAFKNAQTLASSTAIAASAAANTALITGGVGSILALGVGAVGIIGMNHTSSDIAENLNEMQQLTNQLTKTEANVLQNVKGQIKYLSDTIQRAIPSFEYIFD
uniref:hypothetical protein n=1 Tax=Bacillus cereus TaxID=1396 RepID=UPI002852B114|nr:hypothetical protein [Bacillus cereus]